MTPEENKELVRAMVHDLQVRRDLDCIEKYFSPNFYNYSSGGGEPTRDGVRQYFTMFYQAFPDLKAVIHDQVASGDKVVTRKSFHATHLGDLMGIPPTGRSVVIDVIDILEIADGQIISHRNVVDRVGLMQQLGVIPSPAEEQS